VTADFVVLGRAPDLIVPLIGFRQWRLADDQLRSLHSDERWPGATLTARCRTDAHPNDAAPLNGCSCGIYAWYRPCPRTASGTSEYIAGAVVLWGQVELHHAGMRGQHCRIVGLELPFSRWRKRDRVLALAERLGVRAVPHTALRAVAAEHGAPVPKQLIPEYVHGPVGIVPDRILAERIRAATGGPGRSIASSRNPS
jgi:hypothetical protein